MLQAYVVEGDGLKPVSGELAKLSEAYWIDIYEPTARTIEALNRLVVPAGVFVKIKQG